ncbi:MAG: isochorismatase family protein [Patescibacteria group bacterium]|jgi:nicotinamidase/pyrazinamidase
MGNRAHITIDVQNDFCPEGRLAVTAGDEVVPVINQRVKNPAYKRKYNSRDWHPPGSEHFKKWPTHCVEKTLGAAFHPDLDLTDAVIITKGQDPALDGYSAFEGTTSWGAMLEDDLRAHGITDIDIEGLATEYCVKKSAIDGAKRGFNVTVYLDGCRAVNIKPGDEEAAIVEMRAAGVNVVAA